MAVGALPGVMRRRLVLGMTPRTICGPRGCMVEGDILPRGSRMAGSAIIIKMRFRLVLLVAFHTGVGGAQVFSRTMASVAQCDGMLPKEREKSVPGCLTTRWKWD